MGARIGATDGGGGAEVEIASVSEKQECLSQMGRRDFFLLNLCDGLYFDYRFARLQPHN